MRVASLHVYPVKSCRGIALQRASVLARGIEHDRRWMLIDAAGVFVTQREAPALARIDVVLGGDGVVLSAWGHGEVRVPLRPSPDAPRRAVRIWKTEIVAIDCGDAAARWLSTWVGAPVRLVFMPDDATRAVSPEHARPGDVVGFADGFPLLLAATASLADLNDRLQGPVPMDRFRPNLVVSGGAPWDEDGWARVQIGGVALRVAKPCGRCTLITIDQGTGERTGAEPLRTLASFRQREGSALFGQNLIPDAPGWLAVGDALHVTG